MRPAAALLLTALLTGCIDADHNRATPLLGPVDEVGGDRPARVIYPESYATETSYPLVILLHGFGANAELQDAIFQLEPQVEARQFILIKPNGTRAPDGQRFWNATNECCDFYNLEPDDVAYISRLIAEARAHFHIDPTRITLVGHSNGGYMANRYACKPIERITRIVNLAGLSFVDEADCTAPQPVHVLHIHGTGDERVPYESNVTDPSLSNPDVAEDDPRLRAGAFELAERWARRAGCDPIPVTEPAALDLSSDIAGNETDIIRWTGCTTGSSTLLRAHDVGHLWVDGTEQFRSIVLDFALGASDVTR